MNEYNIDITHNIDPTDDAAIDTILDLTNTHGGIVYAGDDDYAHSVSIIDADTITSAMRQAADMLEQPGMPGIRSVRILPSEDWRNEE